MLKRDKFGRFVAAKKAPKKAPKSSPCKPCEPNKGESNPCKPGGACTLKTKKSK